MIRFENVSKRYGRGDAVLRGLNLEIAEREFAVLIGPSGCGKSTTLSLVNRLIAPTAGAVLMDGTDTAEMDPVMLRRRIGFVFQSVGLFPHLTIAENIGITPRLLGWSNQEVAMRVRELLEAVRLPSAYEGRLPRQLSGGEQQRVGLARALAGRPKIMLLDEPFGALDPLVRDELGAEYRAIHDRLGLTTVLVTHDMTEALLLADDIVVMRQGEIVQRASPRDLLRSPAGDFVRSMIDSPRRRAERLNQALSLGAMA
ncbi:MAG TPA: ATP-binding cassette domain-containing protein [Rhizomicrobium sp.]|nr:ATP-binding cassette domain-containing protein [Rhizomicrobium sp.]